VHWGERATTASLFLNEGTRSNPIIRISKTLLHYVQHLFEANQHEVNVHKRLERD
jgi:hypothetical protein